MSCEAEHPGKEDPRPVERWDRGDKAFELFRGVTVVRRGGRAPGKEIRAGSSGPVGSSRYSSVPRGGR